MHGGLCMVAFALPEWMRCDGLIDFDRNCWIAKKIEEKHWHHSAISIKYM